jgi:hypothetical protein
MPVRLGAYIQLLVDPTEWKSTIGKAQDGKRIEGGMECKPRKTAWVTGQDDGPCRQKEDLNEGKLRAPLWGWLIYQCGGLAIDQG